MGYIDCDSHIMENDRTWDYMDPEERAYRPRLINGAWRIEDLRVEEFKLYWERMIQIPAFRDACPPGSVDLSDPAARMRRMDELGVDVQIIFSSFWNNQDVSSPAREAALARSYNRYMAEATAGSGGRLRWALIAPVRTIDRAVREVEFGAKHGAAAIHLRGFKDGLGVGDPSYWPIYAKAQELGLVAAVHVGGDMRMYYKQPHNFLCSHVGPVPAAFAAVLTTNLHQRFPRLRWAFVEAGASWLPWALQESFRSDNFGADRNFRDWRSFAKAVVAEHELYISCQIDDDLSYLLNYAGENNLVHGTDFGHLDIGSDPDGLGIVARRTDLENRVARKIVDDNGRRLYGIDSNFTPADQGAGAAQSAARAN